MSVDGLIGILERDHWVWAADALALALLIGYQLYLGRTFRRQPERTYRGRSNRLRRAWLAS